MCIVVVCVVVNVVMMCLRVVCCDRCECTVLTSWVVCVSLLLLCVFVVDDDVDCVVVCAL